MADTLRRPLTLSEFLAWEARQETRHEFVGGRIRAMVGATRRHGDIAGNIFMLLRAALKGKKCRPFMETLKVITPAGDVRYPDVLVDCGEGKPEDVAAAEPTIVVEVLSRSTLQIDISEKLADYQSVPSINAILHVQQGVISGSLWTRMEDSWRYEALSGPEAIVELSAVDVRIVLGQIYEGVTLDPPPQAQEGAPDS